MAQVLKVLLERVGAVDGQTEAGVIELVEGIVVPDADAGAERQYGQDQSADCFQSSLPGVDVTPY